MKSWNDFDIFMNTSGEKPLNNSGEIEIVTGIFWCCFDISKGCFILKLFSSVRVVSFESYFSSVLDFWFKSCSTSARNVCVKSLYGKFCCCTSTITLYFLCNQLVNFNLKLFSPQKKKSRTISIKGCFIKKKFCF